MAKNINWLAELLELINRGCENSPFIKELENDSLHLETGQELCLTLWPFISALPANVADVRKKVPEGMTDALKFLSQMADDDGQFQKLYVSQCMLAGLTEKDLLEHAPDPATAHLCRLMKEYCAQGSFETGALAVVAAELAATGFARHSLPHYERYFQKKTDDQFSISIDEGLTWLRHHAKPNMRHALWMKRTVEALDIDEPVPPKTLPPTVEELIAAIYGFWRCDRRLLDGRSDSKMAIKQAVAPRSDRE